MQWARTPRTLQPAEAWLTFRDGIVGGPGSDASLVAIAQTMAAATLPGIGSSASG